MMAKPNGGYSQNSTPHVLFPVAGDGIAHAGTSHAAKGGDPTTDNYVAYGFSGGISEDATHTLDGATPHAVAFGIGGDDTSYTLRANPSHSGDKGDGGINTTMVAFTQNEREEVRLIGGDGQTVGARAADAGAHQQNYIAETTNTLRAEAGAPKHAADETRRVASHMAVRRLTPTECESLMGWPAVRKTVIIEVWKDNCTENQKNDAPVGNLNPRSLKPAGNAERSKSPLSVNAVENLLRQPDPQNELSVALNVEINLETRGLRLQTSSGELLLRAKCAESNGWSKSQKQPSDFVQLGALVGSTLEQITYGGKAGSAPSGSLSHLLLNGSVFVRLSGREINEHVNDAERCITTASTPLKSTTSGATSSSANCDLTLQTLCSCVAHAINGYIPETTKTASSYAFSLTIVRGHTAGFADSVRYRMCGNGVVAPVAEWIGKRLIAAAGGAA